MPYEDPLRTEERDLEDRLRRLVPAGHRLQRDNLMFEAGRRAGRRQSRPCQAVAIASLLGMLLLGWYGLKPAPGTKPPALVRIEEPIRTDVMAPPTSVTPPNFAGLLLPPPAIEQLRLRHQLVMEGADALPVPSAYAAPAATIEDITDWHREMAPGGGMPGKLRGLNPRTHGDRS